jgi:hypothetical protein
MKPNNLQNICRTNIWKNEERGKTNKNKQTEKKKAD